MHEVEAERGVLRGMLQHAQGAAAKAESRARDAQGDRTAREKVAAVAMAAVAAQRLGATAASTTAVPPQQPRLGGGPLKPAQGKAVPSRAKPSIVRPKSASVSGRVRR